MRFTCRMFQGQGLEFRISGRAQRLFGALDGPAAVEDPGHLGCVCVCVP